MKVLVVEKNSTTTTTIAKALSGQDYTVEVAADGETGLNLATWLHNDLILLDLSDAKLDGIALCRQLRAQDKQTPILLLASQEAKQNLIAALEAGADDYIMQPFDPPRLIERMQVLLRRRKAEIAPSVLTWGDLRLFTTATQVTYRERPLSLSPKEYQLLELFLLHPQKLFGRSTIIEHLWSIGESPSPAAVTNLIKDLRQKLKLGGMDFDPIETVYGIGYRLKTPPQNGSIAAKREIPDKERLSIRTLEFPNRPEAPNSPFYIERPPIEELAYSEISFPGSVICIKSPPKMGKSSLLNQLLSYGKAQGYTTARIDFMQADESIFESIDKFLRWFCANVSLQLKLPARLDDYWDVEIGSKVSCTMYFEAYILEEITTPLVLALNELDRLFDYAKIAQEFLPLLRYWYEQAQTNVAFEKLRIVMVKYPEIYVDLPRNQSPFNIGLVLELPEFNLKQIQTLADRYELNWQSNQNAEKLMAMVGGHPYLVRLAFYYLSRGEITLNKLLQSAPTQMQVYRDYLRNIWMILHRHPQMMGALKRLLNEPEDAKLDSAISYKLESLGLIKVENNQAKLRCELYRIYLEEQLLITANSL
ncbi:AAA-like domain-containing protein [Microseira wollei]|uniref:Uncharacterized protein n=1 Tax=Microseira wollei NIES-4236 TaxID=2530354 RepID=A0AAV3X4C9_9CYAN|nr:AAA-like domain-containing protein [Microseira wollei]GET37133.1 hypothetical protein MiSe_18860 [Microseira wollei NIES-4236]